MGTKKPYLSLLQWAYIIFFTVFHYDSLLIHCKMCYTVIHFIVYYICILYIVYVYCILYTMYVYIVYITTLQYIIQYYNVIHCKMWGHFFFHSVLSFLFFFFFKLQRILFLFIALKKKTRITVKQSRKWMPPPPDTWLFIFTLEMITVSSSIYFEL